MGKVMTSNNRAYAIGGQARYLNPPMTEPSSRDRAALRPAHPALAEGRTIFPASVFDASERKHVLIEGINNAKTGNQITVGPWRGFRHFNLSLEERATCPRSCDNWDCCFGNGMPVAKRFKYNPALMEALEYELDALSDRFPGGFSVRLHILGDFPDVAYVKHWRMWLRMFPALHVWGYTARTPDSEIGREVAALNRDYSHRWVIRTSVADDAPHGPMQVATTWRKPERYAYDPASQSMICPQEIGNVSHCVLCGICWSPKLTHIRVRFLGHGGRGAETQPRGPRKNRSKYSDPIPETPRPPPSGITDIDAFIAARGITRLPARARGI